MHTPELGARPGPILMDTDKDVFKGPAHSRGQDEWTSSTKTGKAGQVGKTGALSVADLAEELVHGAPRGSGHGGAG